MDVPKKALVSRLYKSDTGNIPANLNRHEKLDESEELAKVFCLELFFPAVTKNCD